MNKIKTDVEYIFKQLAVIKSHPDNPRIVLDCIQRATDAAERVIEALKQEEIDETFNRR